MLKPHEPDSAQVLSSVFLTFTCICFNDISDFSVKVIEGTPCLMYLRSLLMAKEMGLDRGPIEFQTFYFSHVLVVPPNQ